MTDHKDKLQLLIEDKDPKNIEITMSGRLDIHTTADIWHQCIDLQAQQPERLIINAENINYCDGAGIALLQELKNLQAEISKQCLVRKLPTAFQQLLTKIEKQSNKKYNLSPSIHRHAFTERLGYISVGALANMRDNIIFMGMLAYQLCQAVLHPQTIRWKDMWHAIEDVGPSALPIIILVGFLIGLITAFQSAIPLSNFGAQIFIANLVGISLVKELGPLMTAVLLISRTSSSFAAEIGTMKINQEVDALITMGINPIRFLTVPRVIATTLMTPFLNIFLILAGLLGCGIVMYTLGYNPIIFLIQLKGAVHMSALIGGLIKAVVFGTMVAGIGCLHGLKTNMGASAVGRSTTQAVVSGIIMLVIVDGIFAVVYYAIGI